MTTFDLICLVLAGIGYALVGIVVAVYGVDVLFKEEGK